MMPTPDDCYAIAKLQAAQPLNGELAVMSPEWRPLGDCLASVPAKRRRKTLEVALLLRPDRDAIAKAISDIDLTKSPPALTATRCYATLEDIARIVSNQPWLWNEWIASGVLNALASDPGIGKTRFALDLARRLRFALPWPDNQTNNLPAGSRTLWIQGDRNFAEMLQAARDFGLPDDAVVLGSSPDDPTASLDLDDPATLAAIGDRIVAAGVALVVIDTVGMTTARNLSKPEDARDFFAPIIELAHKTATPFLGLTHLSKDKDPLGRRIVEKARVVMMMTQPDPEGHRDRRRLWVSKTAVHKPPALGVTMGDAGNDYDSNPPNEPEPTPRKRGPNPEKLEACKKWLTKQLTPNPVRVADIRSDADKAEFSADTLYKAKDALGAEEYTVDRRKWWKLPAVDDVGVSDIDNSDNSDKPF
jgi:hypothetical protein